MKSVYTSAVTTRQQQTSFVIINDTAVNQAYIFEIQKHIRLKSALSMRRFFWAPKI